jgi:acyl carrier protein
MDQRRIFDEVKACILRVVDIDPNLITSRARLIDDLGMDSLDMLDLTFHLEQVFKVKLSPREFENRAKAELGDTPLDVEGVYTPAALEHIRVSMPEVPAEELADGLTKQQLPRSFRVSTMVNLVMHSLEEKDA